MSGSQMYEFFTASRIAPRAHRRVAGSSTLPSPRRGRCVAARNSRCVAVLERISFSPRRGFNCVAVSEVGYIQLRRSIGKWVSPRCVAALLRRSIEISTLVPPHSTLGSGKILVQLLDKCSSLNQFAQSIALAVGWCVVSKEGSAPGSVPFHPKLGSWRHVVVSASPRRGFSGHFGYKLRSLPNPFPPPPAHPIG